MSGDVLEIWGIGHTGGSGGGRRSRVRLGTARSRSRSEELTSGGGGRRMSFRTCVRIAAGSAKFDLCWSGK